MKNNKIRRMTTAALLVALIVVLQLLGYVLPKIGPFGLSFVLIPIVIGAAYLGVTYGAFLGAVFGVIVCICCANGMDVGGQMVWQANPFLCIFVVMLKGILAGALSGLVYKALSKKNSYIAMLCAAIVCPLANTGIFLLGMNVFFADVLASWAGGSNIITYMLSGIVLINFVPELIINVAFSPAGQRILHAIK